MEVKAYHYYYQTYIYSRIGKKSKSMYLKNCLDSCFIVLDKNGSHVETQGICDIEDKLRNAKVYAACCAKKDPAFHLGARFFLE